MSLKSIQLAMLALAAWSLQHTAAQIFVHDGHTYQVGTTGATWADARSAAQTATQNGVNGYLAIL